MKFSLSVIWDAIFSTFIIFVISFIILNYFIQRPYSIVFAVTISALSTLFLFKIFINANAKKFNQRKSREEYEDMLTQLNFSSKTENNELFTKLFKSMGYDVERKKGGIFLKDKPVAVFLLFGFNPTRKADVVKIFNSLRTNDVAYILSESFSSDILDFASRFDKRIYCINGKTVYTALKEHNFLPEQKYLFKEKKQKGLILFKNLLYKKKAKSYFTFGSVLLLMSYFTPLKLYYVIFGCIFLIASLTVKIFGIPEKSQTE